MSALRWPALAAASCLAASGCTHITHTADVQPGLALSVAAGGGLEHRQGGKGPGGTRLPPEEAYTEAWDLNVNAGYGWRFTEDLALSTTLTLPVGHRSDREGIPAYAMLGVDGYLQINRGVADVGVGITLGNAFSIYGEAGHGWAIPGGPTLRLDGGLRLAMVAGSTTDFSKAVVPFALFTVQGEIFHAGAWADAWVMAPPFDRCDECSGDRVDVAVMGGVVVGYTYDFEERGKGKRR